GGGGPAGALRAGDGVLPRALLLERGAGGAEGAARGALRSAPAQGPEEVVDVIAIAGVGALDDFECRARQGLDLVDAVVADAAEVAGGAEVAAVAAAVVLDLEAEAAAGAEDAGGLGEVAAEDAGGEVLEDEGGVDEVEG